jgi:hypothetical protein
MRKFVFIVFGAILSSAVCLWALHDAHARGGRGGGGGGGGGGVGRGGGGGARGAGGAHRSPSMSRPAGPSARPGGPGGSGDKIGGNKGSSIGKSPGPKSGGGVGKAPGSTAKTRPAGSPGFADLPGRGGVGPGAGGVGRPGGPAGGRGTGVDAVSDFFQDHPTQLPASGGGTGRRPARGEGSLANSRPDRVDNRQGRRDDWRQTGQDVREQFKDRHDDHDHWFGDAWWQEHPHAHWRFHQNTNWWAWSTWGAAAAWVPYGWAEPAYYNYGENIYYQDGNVYYGDQAVATEEEYQQQAEKLATSVPDVKPDKVEWKPLGVFALTSGQGGGGGGEPTMYLQLAMSKEGIIAGTYQNTATDSTVSVEGMIDKKTQRAAWAPVGKKRPIMETGLANLTQNEAPMLIHFADGQTQQWLLVRLEQPKGPAKK